MKRSLQILTLIILFATGLSSCSTSPYEIEGLDMIAVQTTKDGPWSMYKPDGTILYEDEFKTQPMAVYNGFFSVEENGHYVLYRAGKKDYEAVEGCENLVSVGAMNHGVIPVVKKHERITLANEKGATVATLEPVGGKEIVKCEAAFSHDGLLWIETEDEKCGFVDTKGKMVIEPKYDDAASFSDEGYALVAKEVKDKRQFSVIDTKGEVAFKIASKYTPISYYVSFGLLPVRDENDRISFYNTKGELTKMPAKCKNISGYNDKYVVFSSDDGETFGIMTYDGEVVVRPRYESIRIIGDATFLVSKNDNYKVINAKGDEKVAFDDYKSIMWCYQYGLIGVDKSSYTFLKNDGTPINSDAEFADFSMIGAPSHKVESDYFNSKAVVNEILSMIGTNGVGNYRLGSSPGANFSEPKDYTYTSRVSLPDLKKSGFKYTITARADYSASMADYNYTWDAYYNISSYYYWNSASHLESITLTIDTQSQWGKDGSIELVKALKDKGFTLVGTTDRDNSNYKALLSKGDIAVAVSGDGNESDGKVELFLRSDAYTYNRYASSVGSSQIDAPAVEVAAPEAAPDSVVSASPAAA